MCSTRIDKMLLVVVLLAATVSCQQRKEVAQTSVRSGALLASDGGQVCDSRLPSTLVNRQQRPFELVTDARYVYFVNASGGTISRVEKTGGPVTVLVSNLLDPFGIARDGGTLFFSDRTAGKIMKVSINGGAASVVVAGETLPGYLASDSRNVYWTSFGADGSSGVVRGADKTSGQVTTYATGQKQPWAIVTDGSGVFWSNLGEGTIRSAPTAGGQVHLLVQGLGVPVGLAADETRLYWTDQYTGQVGSANKMGGGRLTLAASDGAPWSIAIDEASVYWTDNLHGGLWTAPRMGGGPAAKLANGLFSRGLAADTSGQYWVDAGSGYFDGQVRARRPMADLALLLGFEDATMWQSGGAQLGGTSSKVTAGCRALSVRGSGYFAVTSQRFSSPVPGATAGLAIDVFIPDGQPDPYYLGAVQLYFDSPSAQVYNAYLGQVELTGKPVGAFSTLAYSLPSSVLQALGQPHSDAMFTIAINHNATPEAVVLDNMRFVP